MKKAKTDYEVLEDELPPSFTNSLKKNYLGNPALVQKLVAKFCADFEQRLFDKEVGKISPEEFVSQSEEDTRRMAKIFRGEDDRYEPIPGYNRLSLRYKLMADLGSQWRKNRDKWDDDSLCVLFETLALALAEALKKSKGDLMLKQAYFGESFTYTVQVLLGIEERQK